MHRAEVTRAKAKILLQCDRGSDREAQGTGFLEEATGDRNTKRTRGSEPGKAGRARAYRVDPHGATVRQVRSAPSSQARASSANTGETKCLAVPCPQPRNRSLLWEETSCPPCPPAPRPPACCAQDFEGWGQGCHQGGGHEHHLSEEQPRLGALEPQKALRQNTDQPEFEKDASGRRGEKGLEGAEQEASSTGRGDC